MDQARVRFERYIKRRFGQSSYVSLGGHCGGRLAGH